MTNPLAASRNRHLDTATRLYMGMLVVLVMPVTSSGYNVSGIPVDFDCGDIGDTMSLICKTFPTARPYSRVSRSAGSDALGQDARAGQTTPLDLFPQQHRFHPRALNLEGTKERDMMKDILMSPEAAHALVRTAGSRAKRSYNVHDECCNHVSQRMCVAEEILEYCQDPVP
uniref:Insulin-like androgenic gland factor n=1 Tax=Penaeus japonicus TaxID=27405 RepID=F2Z953_PENJP|nr:insulin-like androgenic gland factor [Penaeus japonicus]